MLNLQWTCNPSWTSVALYSLIHCAMSQPKPPQFYSSAHLTNLLTCKIENKVIVLKDNKALGHKEVFRATCLGNLFRLCFRVNGFARRLVLTQRPKRHLENGLLGLLQLEKSSCPQCDNANNLSFTFNERRAMFLYNPRACSRQI